MRLQGLALCLLLVACGGSSKHAQAPESTTTGAPGGGAPAEGAATAPEPVEAAKPAEMPAAAPTPMAADTKAAPKPKTRGPQKKGGSKDEDPDAGGE
jgi:hypothetical protein